MILVVVYLEAMGFGIRYCGSSFISIRDQISLGVKKGHKLPN